MIFQRWVMSHCDGKPREALRRIEAVTSRRVDFQQIQRALRRPVALPIKLAQLVVAASEGACTLAELLDAEHIRKRFAYSNPELHLRGLEYAMVRAQRRRAAYVEDIERAHALVAQLDADIAELSADIDALTAGETDAA